MNLNIKINNNTIGSGNPVYFIAELSANHCGDFEIAKKSIKAAKDCGADAVKIQTYTADSITLNCKSDIFKIKGGTIWDDKYLYDLYQEAHTPWDWQPNLKKYADDIGITLFSSPFDNSAVDFLEKMNVPAYKIASFEAVDIPLIEYTAKKGKPIIISTGICSKTEIQDAVDACKRVGNNQIILLKCTSAYPAKLENMNLLTIPDMINKFNVIAGLSDHTMNIETPVVAVSLGACVVEKHFTLDRNLGGADSAFSLNPEELKQTIISIRNAEKLLGSVNYSISENNRKFARSLFIVKDLKKGDVLTENVIRSVRPSNGIAPKYYKHILGKKVNTDIKFGTPLSFDFID